MTPDDLIAFETSIAAEFNAGKIPYPVHLESGNENQLIEIFKDVRPNDWIFGSWRGHLKALLKIHMVLMAGLLGPVKHDVAQFTIASVILKAAIKRGESMALCFPEYRVYGSAIVGGTIPIALGVALAIKRYGGNSKVWCFLGDMTFQSGIVYECITYADNFELPITWVVEDNGVSVCTDTREAWGFGHERGPEGSTKVFNLGSIRYYQYQSKWPHAGAGARVQF
jgi:pyruvate dehydrogenase E1 component alpha subunit